MHPESTIKRIVRYFRLIARLIHRKVYRFPSVNLETLRPFLVETAISEFSEGNSEALPSLDFGAWQEQVADGFDGYSSNFEQAIDDLIGVKGMARPSPRDLNGYLDFILFLSPSWNLWNLFKEFDKAPHLRMADLGSVVDVAILLPKLSRMGTALRILEIGGGYGRLAEALIRNIGPDISLDIQMIDVVPSSLTLAEEYLRSSAIPTVRDVQHQTRPGSFVRLARAEKLSLVQTGTVNLVVNIESFQEMTPEWVRWYLEELNRVTQPGSYFYSSNSFGYKNFFELELGSEWRLESSFNHPRHWTDSHRTELWTRIAK